MIRRICNLCRKDAHDIICGDEAYKNRSIPMINLSITTYDEFNGFKTDQYDFCPECSKFIAEKIEAAIQERKRDWTDMLNSLDELKGML